MAYPGRDRRTGRTVVHSDMTVFDAALQVVISEMMRRRASIDGLIRYYEGKHADADGKSHHHTVAARLLRKRRAALTKAAIRSEDAD